MCQGREKAALNKRLALRKEVISRMKAAKTSKVSPMDVENVGDEGNNMASSEKDTNDEEYGGDVAMGDEEEERWKIRWTNRKRRKG